MLLDSENSGAAIENYLIETERRGKAAAENLAQLDSRFDEIGTRHAQTIGELLARFEELATRADTMSDQVASELANTIDGLRAALNQELAGFEDGATGKIAALSDEFGSRTAEALERAVSERATDAIVEIGRKANESASAGQDAVALLRDQLARVAELTANLESRVEHARERATEQSDDDFSRRVAIITESLNSAGIDIAQKLNADVSDTEWTAYLRGDRGIFTRRAVRLLDAVEARTIAETYDRDPDFRAIVGRYHRRFRSDAANHAFHPRRQRAGGHAAQFGHGETVCRAGAGDRAPSNLGKRLDEARHVEIVGGNPPFDVVQDVDQGQRRRDHGRSLDQPCGSEVGRRAVGLARHAILAQLVMRANAER